MIANFDHWSGGSAGMDTKKAPHGLREGRYCLFSWGREFVLFLVGQTPPESRFT